MSKIIIASNRLPVRAEKEGNTIHFTPSEGGLATGLGSVYKNGENIWLGWPGQTFEDEKEQARVQAELAQDHMAPVFLDQADLDGFYFGFSNQTLWPAFHYFTQYIEYDEDFWQAYVKANRKFADAILKLADPDDIIWVHDYQLLLVPKMLREKLPDASIGFFNHIPFPSYEIFRTIPWRQELLEGALGSDFIGFHTYDDMRHFLSSVHRLTGFSYRNNTVQVDSRTVEVDALPMGIDYDKFAEQASAKETQEHLNEIKRGLKQKKIILSVDRLDYSKGIPSRLHAFWEFLKQNPDYHNQVSLILIVVPSRHKVPSYGMLKDEVDELVGKINGYFSNIHWRPIHYFYRSFSLPELSAFYVLSDIAMITPLRDGMNLVCKEYIASRKNQDGVLILSEMAGSAKELSEAILVNPNNQQSLVDSISDALEMSREEQEMRMRIMQRTLQNYNIFHWVTFFTYNLKRVKANQRKMASTILNEERLKEVANEFKLAQKRLLILDYDGTLVPFQKDPEACVPDEELRDIFEKLIANPQNELAVVSGRPAKFLEEHLGHYPIDLAAEHGIWFKEKHSTWELNNELPSDNWKNEARAVIQFYVDRTPGSFLEEKKHALVWHFRRVETGLAAFRSSELNSHLRHVMADKEIEVMLGNQVIEVKPMASNKGKASLKLMQLYRPNFIVAIGDDRTDEYTFDALGKENYTIKVGTPPTKARFSVPSTNEVRALLKKFI